MKNHLEEFAIENITNASRSFKADSRYGRALDALTNTEKKLIDAMADEMKETFKRYVDLNLELNYLSNIDKFIHGYRLGVLMTAEVFIQSDDVMYAGEEEF